MYGWGFDLGVASVGSMVISCDSHGNAQGLVDGSAHIFKASVGGQERTRYKSARTQNERSALRIRKIENELREILGSPNAMSTGQAKLSLTAATGEVGEDGKAIQTNSRVHLRALGLQQALRGDDLFKAIIHIAKNRGPRLSRGLKDKSEDNGSASTQEQEQKTSLQRYKNTKHELEKLGHELGMGETATPGQLLFKRLKEGQSTRLHKHDASVPLFIRQQVQDELERLLKAQAEFHKELERTETRQRIFDLVFWEADPKPPAIGKCLYGQKDAEGRTEERLARATELFQLKRIYEELNNLRLRDRQTAQTTELTLEQRDRLAAHVLNGNDLSAAKLREILFGKEKNKALTPLTSLEEQVGHKGRKTAGKIEAHPLAEAMKKAGLIDQWNSLLSQERESLFRLLREEDDRTIVAEQLKNSWGIEGEASEKLLALRLPQTRSAAGPTATDKLLRELRADVVSSYEAEQRASLTRSDLPVEKLENLPYYGELFREACVGGTHKPGDPPEKYYGRIPNPVVHTVLNRVRKICNRYLKLYGPPDFINVELARDLNKSQEEREEIDKKNKSNQKKNDDRAKIILLHGAKVNRENLLRVKLHEMQGFKCLYTGTPLSTGQLFDGTAEIDHILPRSKTLDDGIGNLALVTKESNAFKRERPPSEAFKNGYNGQDYPTLLKRVEESRKPCLWRFQPDAMEKFWESGGMRARYLNDTRYVAKIASAYLAHLTGDRAKVLTVTGAMSAQLRHLWGLDEVVAELMVEDGRLDERILSSYKPKTDAEREERVKVRRKLRFDHRHHLLDAIIVACVTRSDVQRLETLAARAGSYDKLETLLKQTREEGVQLFREKGISWDSGFRKHVKGFLKNDGQEESTGHVTRVTHKADHNPLGQLHEETYYSIICEVPGKPGQYVCSSREPLENINRKSQVISLPPSESVHAILKKAQDNGQKIWIGNTSPIEAFAQLSNQLERLKNCLLNDIDKAPTDKISPEQNNKPDPRVEWAVAEHSRTNGQRSYRKIEVKSLRVLRGPVKPGGRPLAVVASGNNDRLVHWIDREGNKQWEVVMQIDAVTPDFQEAWQREGGRFVFRLRKGDIVEMLTDASDPQSDKRLYQLRSLSKNDYEFVPIEEARSAGEGRKGLFTARMKSERALNERQIRHVVLSPDGRVKWRSRLQN